MRGAENPFISAAAARRYAAHRPDYSDRLAGILRREVGRADRALDVAAGTGLATRALTAIAASTVAIDASEAMIGQRSTRTEATWVVAGAESLPFAPATFDLIAVGSALHWFRRDAFVTAAERVGRPDAVLVVHDHRFTGRMHDVPAFTDWMHHRYLRGYPTPPRGEKLAPGTDLGSFRFVSTHRYDHPVDVTRDGLAGYLTSQSNLQVVMTSERAAADVVAWLERELAPFFADGPRRRVMFSGLATILRRR